MVLELSFYEWLNLDTEREREREEYSHVIVMNGCNLGRGRDNCLYCLAPIK